MANLNLWLPYEYNHDNRQISLYTLGAMDIEFRCLEEDSRPPDRILNESRSFGRQEMIADFSEISKHSTEIYG